MGLETPGGKPNFNGAAGFNGNIVVARNHGFRAFRYHPEGRLSSLVFDKANWTAGVNHAVHLNRGFQSRPEQSSTCPFPHKGCSHGFYAYYDEDYFEPTMYNSGSVRIDGVIDGFGRCVIGDKGYRAEYAVIIAFVKPYTIACDFQRKINLEADEIERLVTKFLEEKFPAAPIFDSVDDLKAVIPLDGRPPRNDE